MESIKNPVDGGRLLLVGPRDTHIVLVPDDFVIKGLYDVFGQLVTGRRF
jgi:hypothetical protein